MRDCDDPTARERISLALIPVGCAFMAFLRRQRQPGSKWTLALVFALGVVTVLKEKQIPESSWWEQGNWGQWLFVGLSIPASLGTLLVIIGFRRLLTRHARGDLFKESAESFAKLALKETSLRKREVGVNIWLVRGMLGFRRLVRETTVVATERHETPIRWTKGKGIIGEAWGRKKIRIADLDRVREAFTGPETWCQVKREDRFRLSWDEFDETKRYCAVLAVPLRRHRWSLHPVKGVAAIDSLVPGKFDELKRLAALPEFSSVRRACEGAFGGDD